MKLTIKAKKDKKEIEHTTEIERLGQVKEHVKAFGLIHKVDQLDWTVSGDGSITTPVKSSPAVLSEEK